MEFNKKCEVEVKEESSKERDNRVEDVKIRSSSSLRKDSLFLTRKRLSKRSENEMDCENINTIEEDEQSSPGIPCSSSLQIHIDKPLSEYGNTRKNDVDNITKGQRHVVIVEEKQELCDKKVSEDVKSDQL